MKSASSIIPLIGSIAFLLPAGAAEIQKANNATALNLPGAWQAGALPGTGDVMLWDATVLAPGAPRTVGALSALGVDTSIFGLKVTNVGGARNVAASAVGIQNASSANTLTIGAGGIDLTTATHAFYLEPKITLSANQNWIINNASTHATPMGFNNNEDLGFRAMTAATATTANTPFDLGGFAATTSGNGSVTMSSGYNVTNGTINIGNALFLMGGGDTRAVIVANTVNLNVATGAILHFQSNSGIITSSAAIGLTGGTLKLVSANAANQVTVNNTVTVNSASTLLVGNNVGNASTASTNGIIFNANLLGSANLALTNNASTASVLVMNGDNSGYSGTINYTGTAGRIARLNSATAGSANATWNVGAGVVLQTNNVSVSIGTLNGAGIVNNNSGAGIVNVGAGTFSGTLVNAGGTLGLTKVGPGTLTLSGANTYTDATTVSQGTLITSPAQTGATAVTVADGATFGVKLAAAGTTLAVPSVTVGSATGGSLSFDVVATGNPTAAVLNAGTFTPLAGTSLKLIGAYAPTGGTPFPLISYTGSIGGGGFAGLSLALPFRVSGSLFDDMVNSLVAVNITGTATPTWAATVNTNWDIDNVGNGSVGTANWAAASGPNTYVQGAPVGTDNVIFDDSVGGITSTVNLTATLTPGTATVNNTTVNYLWQGAGKLSGLSNLVKNGTGTLRIANTTPNDNTIATTITQGTIAIGDGATAGAGSLGAAGIAIAAGGALTFDRPDAYTQAGAISGAGTLNKNQANTVTLSGANSLSGAININAGALTIGVASTITAALSGPGALNISGGTTQLGGATANTNTGLTTVTTGILQLNKPASTDAVGGDITVTGTGTLAILAAEQVPNTATFTLLGTSTSSIPTQIGGETFGNVVVNSSTPGFAGGQIIMQNGFAVLGTATINSGILGIGSNFTSGTINAINITATDTTSALLRIAGNSAASVLNIGAGGITASGGDIQVKFNTTNQDATLNLAGNFTTTGNVIVTNGGYAGVNANVINLIGSRTFNIGTGTTTTVAPDFGGAGDLLKTGNGILQLNASSNAAHTGVTDVVAGTLLVHGAITGTASLSISGGILGGTGTITPASGNSASLYSGKISPGASVGTLSFVLSGGGLLDVSSGVTSAASQALVFELDTLAASDKIVITGGALNIGTGVLEFDDFAFTALGGFAPDQDYLLFDGNTPIVGTFGSSVSGSVGGFIGELQFTDGGNDIILHVPEPGSATLLLAGLGLLARRRRR